MTATALFALAGIAIGAIAGSFLAVVVLRWPVGASVVGGRSRCDACGRTLDPGDLVPILSLVARRGRCRRCGARIDPLHGGMEAGCAAIGGAAMLLAPGWPGAVWALFGWGLLTLAVLDARHFWLPDALTVPLGIAGLALGGVASGLPIADRLIGAAAGGGMLLALALGYRALRGREGLGLGDAKLTGAIGAWLGWQMLPLLLLLASLGGLAAALGLRLAGRGVDGTTRLPLGTFLCLAALPAWLIARGTAGGV
jgi:leader peptidase (prepilin peptidase)/N-methyltransferase